MTNSFFIISGTHTIRGRVPTELAVITGLSSPANGEWRATLAGKTISIYLKRGDLRSRRSEGQDFAAVSARLPLIRA